MTWESGRGLKSAATNSGLEEALGAPFAKLAASARNAAARRKWEALAAQKTRNTATLPTPTHRQNCLNSGFTLSRLFQITHQDEPRHDFVTLQIQVRSRGNARHVFIEQQPGGNHPLHGHSQKSLRFQGIGYVSI
jgi:hypothetical protein